MKIPRWKTPKRQAYMKAWHEKNPRDRRAYKKRYDEEHLEENKTYRKKNAAKLKKRSLAYYQNHREQILARVKRYTEENYKKVLAYHREHYKENAGRIKANVAAYRQANPEKKSALESRRRARKKGNGGSHTAEEWQAKLILHLNACYYCKGKDCKLTKDHMIPLKLGGTDDIENLVPACQSCNSKKNARTAEEYLLSTPQAVIGGVGVLGAILKT